MYSKLLEEFIAEVKNEGTYATKEELYEVTKDMISILEKNGDKTPKEIIDILLADNIKTLENLKNNYPTPGYTVGVNVENIDVKLVGGDIDYTGRKMQGNELFDIASTSKFYTQIIIYNLIKENIIKFDDKIKDLDPRFVNLDNLTVRDITTFTTVFKRFGHLPECKTIEEAKECLYKVSVVKTGEYNYNDEGLEIMREVIENVTGLSYQELINKYIVNKIRLDDTHLVVPEDKFDRVTGTPNANVGMINDPAALALGGYSGHAGIIASSDDLIKLGKNIYGGDILPQDMLKDVYTPGVSENRGIMGDTYVSTKNNSNPIFVDKLEPITNFSVQGSTRAQLNIGKCQVSTILLNPCSMGMERAKLEEEKINFERKKNGEDPLTLTRTFTFDRNGNEVKYNLIDPRKFFPIAATTAEITRQNAILSLRLRFLNKVMQEYDKNYTEEIKVDKYL